MIYNKTHSLAFNNNNIKRISKVTSSIFMQTAILPVSKSSKHNGASEFIIFFCIVMDPQIAAKIIPNMYTIVHSHIPHHLS